jgi:serine protease Do
MTQRDPVKSSRRQLLVPRRIALMASVTGLGIAILGGYGSSAIPAWAATGKPIEAPASQTLAPAAGFADLVVRVKPAVISVRVKFDGVAQASNRGSNSERNNNDSRRFGRDFQDFFRQFGFGNQFGDNQFGNRFGDRFGENLPNIPDVPNGARRTAAEGSGFFISADGYAVTNDHVINNAKSVQVITDDGRTFEAKVVGTDPKTDLALIKVDGDNFPFVQFADQNPRIGDWVVAVGNPFGLGGTVTAGVVSATGRDIGSSAYDDYMQIDAPINRGNSGGPSFDINGNVIGVNTAIFSPSGGSVGIGFDIPAATAKMVIAQLKDKGYVTRGWMGVQVQGVTKDIADSVGLKKAEGAIVAEPQAGSPAAQAGIKERDVITAVNGKEMKDGRDLARTIAGITPGTSVRLDVWRNGETKTMSVTLGQLPDERQVNTYRSDASGSTPRLGLTLAPANEVGGAGDKGVAVTAVDPNGPAAEHGMQTGDVILDVGGKSVSKPDDIRQELAALQKAGKSTVLMRVKSGDSTRFVAVPFGKA